MSDLKLYLVHLDPIGDVIVKANNAGIAEELALNGRAEPWFVKTIELLDLGGKNRVIYENFE